MKPLATRVALALALALAAACSDDGGAADQGGDLGVDGPTADSGADLPGGGAEAGPDGAADMAADTGGDAGMDATSPDAAVDQSGADGQAGAGPLRVATINCYCLKDSPAQRIKGIAAEIKALNPDAVGLQEVCQTISLGGSDNFAKALAAELKTLTGKDWEHRYAKTHVAWSLYDEGVGLLAPKGSITKSGELSLPKGGGAFPRKAAWAMVKTPRGSFYLYSTHLTISSNPADRTNQVKAILGLVNQHSAGVAAPHVVVGDFNDWYGSGAITAMKSGPPAFTESWGTKHPGSAKPGLTCCRPSFKSRIDYVFINSAALKTLDKVELAFTAQTGGVSLSDHMGLFAEFTPK